MVVGSDLDQVRKSHMRLTLSLCVFMATLVTAAVVGEVDIAAKAVGRLIPDGQVKTVQSSEAGTIAEILVREGATVEAGALLVRLDTADASADAQRLATELAIARVEFARLKATIDYERKAIYQPPADSPSHLSDASAQFMRNQIEQLASAILGIDANIKEKEASVASARASINKSGELLPILREREMARAALLKKEAVSKLAYLDDKERLVNLEGDLRVQEAKLLELQSGVDSLRENRRNVISKFLSDRSSELVETQRRLLTVEQDYNKALERLKRHSIVAPIAGNVQDLTVYTVGGVVRSAERLMTIVPLDSKLIVDALVSNRDIGLVEAGQEAEIRVTAFDYRKYGTIRGKLTNVSLDMISPDQAYQMGVGRNPNDRPLDPKNPHLTVSSDGPQFRAQLSLERTTVEVEDEEVDLTAGMAIEANILVGRRRIIDFFLEPFQSYRQEAFRQ